VRGDPDEVIDRLRAYEAAGASHILLTPIGRTPDELLQRIEHLAELVARV